MTTATSSQHALARWLLTSELAEPSERVLDPPATAERVFEKLSHRLAQLITPVGSEALLARAVHLSRANFPFLDGAQTTYGADAVTLRLRDTVTDVAPSEAREGFVALLGTLIALLVSFIGEDLTFRVLRDVWPEVPMAQPVQPVRQNGINNLELTP